MSQLLWLLSKITYLLLKAGVRIGLELTGCMVRLLYWSVRTYGWGRVGSFLLAFSGSLWLHAQFGWLSLSSYSLAGVLVSTLGLWGALLGGAIGLSRYWQWRWTADQPRLQDFIPKPAHRMPNNVALAEGTELWERLLDPATLQQAWQRVMLRGGGPGSDGVTLEVFSLDLERNLQRLRAQLQSGLYRPRPPRWVEVPKLNGGTRHLGVLCVQDRIVQQALLLALMPQWDRRFAPCSYAYRPGRSALQAITEVERALAAGRVWVVDADIKSFFDSVPHAPLFALLEEWLPDGRVRQLVEICVSAPAPASGRGLTQGAPLSPLLANLYLHRFDSSLLQTGHQLIRYADDFVILCATRPQAEQALQTAQHLLEGLELRLNYEKTRIVHRDEGFTFLGWTFDGEGKRPSEHAVESLQLRLASASDEAKRRQILAGWQGYFREAAPVCATSSPAQGAEPFEDSDDLPWWADIKMNGDGDENEEEEAGGVGPADGSASDSALTRYRELFLGRPDAFARFWQSGNRQGYTPIRRVPTDQELQEHLTGQTVLGTYLLLPDGHAKALVLDIDGPGYTEEDRAVAFQVAQQLIGELRQNGVRPLWVDSGGKGFHIWLCFSHPVAARQLRQWANRFLDRFRPFPSGVLVEVFPKQDSLAPSALGALIRLPFGRHPQTGRWSMLLAEEGQPVEELWTALEDVSLLDPQPLLEIEPIGALPKPPEAIAPVVEGCALIAELIKKAAQMHHLRHTERLALLYILGHLGEAGRNYLHQVIALCSNYNPRITERWIRRLEEGHRSIRCATLKEWLKDYLPGVECPCPLKRANPSPLDLLRQARKPQADSSAVPGSTAIVWKDVAEEMFGEALAEFEGAEADQPQE